MNQFFAHIPYSKERQMGLKAHGVKSTFIVQKKASLYDWEELQKWIDLNQGEWILSVSSFESGFCFLGLDAHQEDNLNAPALVWVVPEKIEILSAPETITPIQSNSSWHFSEGETQNEYIQNLDKIKNHLLRGDFYETNYCTLLQSKEYCNEPYEHWKIRYQAHPSPHAAYFQWNDIHLLCLSPERFIKKQKSTLISQPIKGTIQRKKNKEEDQKVIEWLTHSQKDKSENTMIVDLVRNDMSKIAQKNSVVVPELCAIYTFPTLHHMISTIQCEIKSNTHVIEIFKALFPMGSMTGVPKKISVQKMNEMEKKPRGWYSGTCGWMSPDGNFDFNVIIRSIVYNKSTGESKIGIGSAITLASDFKSEWAECKLKARSLTSPQLANEN